MQNLLLALGVLLLAVAAVIFLVVSWGVLGVGGRAAVMTAFTAIAAAGATVAARRGLSATGEAVATLTVGLGLLDAYGARSAGLADLDATAALPYWAGALALIALAAGAWAVLLPLRSLRLSAAVLGQLPGWLLAGHWSDDAVHPAAVVATVLTIQAVIGIALVLAWPSPSRAADARWAVVVGAGVAWTVAAVAAVGAAYGEDGSLVLGTALLLVLAGAAVGTAIATDSDRGTSTALGLPDALLGVAALAVVAAVWAPVTELADPDWVPVTLSAIAAVLLAAMLLVPVSRRAVAGRRLPARRGGSRLRRCRGGRGLHRRAAELARRRVGRGLVVVRARCRRRRRGLAGPRVDAAVAAVGRGCAAGGRSRCAVPAYGGCTRRTGARSRGADGAGCVRPAVLGGAVDRRRGCVAAAGRGTGARASSGSPRSAGGCSGRASSCWAWPLPGRSPRPSTTLVVLPVAAAVLAVGTCMSGAGGWVPAAAAVSDRVRDWLGAAADR